MSEKPDFNKIYPGEKRTTIPPLNADNDSGNQNIYKEGMDRDKKPVNIEDRNLPGNFGFTGRLASALEAKWVGATTNAALLPTQFRAGHHMRTADARKLELDLLKSEQQRHKRNKLEYKGKKAALKHDTSYIDRFAVGRLYKKTWAQWYSLKESRNKRAESIKSGEIREVEAKLAKSEKMKSFCDTKLGDRIASAERRLNSKMPHIELLQKESENALERLTKETADYAKKATKWRSDIDALMTARMSSEESPEEEKRNDKLLERLNEEYYKAEAAIKVNLAKQKRCTKHLIRLERAAAISGAAVQYIKGRHAEHLDRSSVSEETGAPENTSSSEEVPPDPMFDLIDSIANDLLTPDKLKIKYTPDELIAQWSKELKEKQPATKAQYLEWWDKRNTTTGDPILIGPQDTARKMKNGGKISLNDWKVFLTYLAVRNESFREAFISRAEGRTIEKLVNRMAVNAL